MENMLFNLPLTLESIISIIGVAAPVVIAIIGGIYAIVTSRTKYELTENYRKELLQWYTSVVEVMAKIIHYSESGKFSSREFSSQRIDMLSQLSALTEVGRFYFPTL